jgi:hypothetical protein
VRAGYSASEISFLLPDTQKKFTTSNPKGEVTLVPTNTLGGSLGTIVGLTALSIPSFGPFVVAGTLTTSLKGKTPSGSGSLISSALVSAGISETEAKKYEAALKSGNILIYVGANSDEKVTQATEILKQEGAKDISATRDKVRSV